MKKFLVAFIILCALLFSSAASAMDAGVDSGKAEVVDHQTETVEKIEKGILYLLRLAPRHPAVRCPEVRRELAEAIYLASDLSGLPWDVITALAYRESTFRMSRRGDIGEMGIMQLHGSLPWKHCKKVLKRKLNKHSMEDQLICGAFWFIYGKDEVCDGTIAQGHAKYLTKATCRPKTRSLKAKVRRRLKIAAKILSKDVQE